MSCGGGAACKLNNGRHQHLNPCTATFPENRVRRCANFSKTGVEPKKNNHYQGSGAGSNSPCPTQVDPSLLTTRSSRNKLSRNRANCLQKSQDNVLYKIYPHRPRRASLHRISDRLPRSKTLFDESLKLLSCTTHLHELAIINMPLFSSRRRAVAAPVPARPRKAGLFSRTRRTRATGPMATSTRTSRRSARSGGTALTRRPTMGDKIHGMSFMNYSSGNQESS